ncbi:uncharacterized protein CIMG_12914 [Coccidioides immitis RS]|uniref:Uncharacterized protein n=1 Tax=Coccidioides immitis (strain RS) TaxID=246410 RepID=J3KG38_COCIM|nr:uncharacterized protein CIMG_12914 [Coccidioides immitis RS]EAS34668.3 hypothetical protein CIMG_12914 [Coccidioides immitis RS]
MPQNDYDGSKWAYCAASINGWSNAEFFAQFWSSTKVLKAHKRLDEIKAEKADKIAQTQEEDTCKKTCKQQETEKIKHARQKEAQHVAYKEKKGLQLAEKEKQMIECAAKCWQSGLQAPAAKHYQKDSPTKESHYRESIQSSKRGIISMLQRTHSFNIE